MTLVMHDRIAKAVPEGTFYFRPTSFDCGTLSEDRPDKPPMPRGHTL
jgi:hypothetical protein